MRPINPPVARWPEITFAMVAVICAAIMFWPRAPARVAAEAAARTGSLAPSVQQITDTPPASASQPALAASPSFEAALAVGDFSSAVEQYSLAYDRALDNETLDMRQTLLQRASDLNQARQFEQAVALLSRFRAVFYRDVDAAVLAGRAYRDSGRYPEAIDSYLVAASYTQDPDVLRMVQLQLNWTINLHVQRLQGEEALDEVVEFYSYLTQSAPFNPHYYLALAKAYMETNRSQQALAILQYLQADEDVADEVAEMVSELAGA